jgi:hypothetical protein
MNFLDPYHPFFRPFHRRALTTGACFAWALFELANGATFWAAAFAALGAFCGWYLLIAYDPEKGREE